MEFIEKELNEIQRNCERFVPNSKLIVCLQNLVRIEINQTKSRKITVCARFPKNYPQERILLELKSSTLDSKFLNRLTVHCDEKLKEFLCEPQVLEIFKYISYYLREKPLCIVYEELSHLQNLIKDNGSIKVKQRKSSIILDAKGGGYYFKAEIFVPEDYPEKCVHWSDCESNLPLVLQRYLNGQAREIARQCVEPPLRKEKNASPFIPKPSFKKSLEFIINATKEFYKEFCPICHRRCLPDNPEAIVTNEHSDDFIERVFCGHLYHQGCLKQYFKEPPFPLDGKKCPALSNHPRPDNSRGVTVHLNKNEPTKSSDKSCGIPLAHDRWGISSKLAEDRWAHQQARARELDEVKDFLK